MRQAGPRKELDPEFLSNGQIEATVQNDGSTIGKSLSIFRAFHHYTTVEGALGRCLGK